MRDGPTAKNSSIKTTEEPKSGKRNIQAIVIILAVVTFFIFIIPNAKASEDLGMVQVFEPDEAALFPTIANMASPKGDTVTFIKKFIVYERYNKGFPFYGPSAALLLFIRWIGQEKNIPLSFLLLRQLISVLPMIGGLLLLVWIQDGFRTYRSILTFLLLLVIPASVQNGFWWHTDGLTLLLSVVVICCLYKDKLQFGKFFFGAAVACGVLTATKMMGVFFFLTVATLLIWGIVEKKITFLKAIFLGLGFVGTMVAAFLISNPFLFSVWGRAGYIYAIRAQMSSLSEGYGVVYAKGLSAAWPLMREHFGSAVFLFLSPMVCIYGLTSKQNRFLNAILLTWYIPLTFYITFFSHFKYQYWLPVVLPLISCWTQILPEKIMGCKVKNWQTIGQIVLFFVLLGQFVCFTFQSTRMFFDQIHRAENNPYIMFRNTAAEALEPVADIPVNVYYDYRLYVPEPSNWELSTEYNPISYSKINDNNFDILLLANQRVLDYLNPEVEGVDPELFAESQYFYQDVMQGEVQGFHLLALNEAGAIFIRQELCKDKYPTRICD